MLERAASDGTIVATMLRPVRLVRVTNQTGSPVQNVEDQRMLAWEGPHQGKHTLGCHRLGRPGMAPPHAIKTRDEQHIRLEEKVKR